MTACASLKKASLVATSSAVGGAIASIASSSPVPVILGSAGSAFVTTAVVETMAPKGVNKMECAPTNFFDIVEALITQASYWLLLLVAIPMILGWILPGPLERKKAK